MSNKNNHSYFVVNTISSMDCFYFMIGSLKLVCKVYKFGYSPNNKNLMKRTFLLSCFIIIATLLITGCTSQTEKKDISNNGKMMKEVKDIGNKI